MDLHLGFGTRRSQRPRFFLDVALYSSTSNLRRLKRYNVFLKYHPRFSLEKVGGGEELGAAVLVLARCVGARTLAMGLNIMLMGLATTVAPSDNITAKFCFSLWLLSTHWCRLKFFCACWHCQMRFLCSSC